MIAFLEVSGMPNEKSPIEDLRKALLSDENYRIGFHANIAMSFKDEYVRHCGDYSSKYERIVIHKIANQAASNFIEQLIK